MADVNETIRTNIRAIREERGFSEEELSERCDLAPRNVGKIEKGTKDLVAEDLVKLAVELETRVSDFFVKNGQPREHAQSIDQQQYDLGSLVNGSENGTGESTSHDLESLFNTSENLLLLLDEDGGILRANQEYVKLAGEEPDTDDRTPFWESPLWIGANQRRIRHLVEGLRESKKYCTEVVPASTPRETTRPMRVSLCPILSEDGALRRILFEAEIV